MANKKNKRTRKRRGTPGGSIVKPKPQSGGKLTKEQRRAELLERQQQRLNSPPTLKSAVTRSLVAAVVFLALLMLLFDRPFATSLALSGFMFVIYIPIGLFTERAMYRRRQAKKHGKSGRGGR